MEDYIDVEEMPVPDLTYLRSVTGDDKDAIKEVITIFIETAPEMLTSLKNSALAGNHEQLRAITHKFIPQLVYVGILSVITDVKIINSESKEMNDLMQRVEKIIKIVNNSIDYLKNII